MCIFSIRSNENVLKKLNYISRCFPAGLTIDWKMHIIGCDLGMKYFQQRGGSVCNLWNMKLAAHLRKGDTVYRDKLVTQYSHFG